MPQRRIYLDYAATTPLDPRVVEAMLPYLTDHFGNPSSLHATGRRARRAIEDAREQIAQMLSCQPTEILFTSGGTESDNSAVLGIARAQRAAGQGNHVVTSRIEHHAVLHACGQLEAEGFRVSYVPVDENGILDPKAVEAALSGDTVLVSVMAVNNEIGTIEPVWEVASVCRARGIPMHTDAIQAVGILPVSLAEWGVDALSLTAHKFYGPKGVGLLVLRHGVPFQPLMAGGGQEREQRPGTENVAAIVGMAQALRLAHEERGERVAHAQDIAATPGTRHRSPHALGSTQRTPDHARCKHYELFLSRLVERNATPTPRPGRSGRVKWGGVYVRHCRTLSRAACPGQV